VHTQSVVVATGPRAPRAARRRRPECARGDALERRGGARMTSSVEQVDVLVIGGGPAGSTIGNLLPRAGPPVLVAQRGRFPRFHIGESLLPYGTPILRRLGVLEEVDRVAQRKWGARFCFEPDGLDKAVDFSNGLDPHKRMAFQVRRAEFDTILLRAAAKAGADVREEHALVELVHGDDGVRGAVLRDARGTTCTVHARVVVDASGRDTAVGAHLARKQRDPDLNQAALFGHFTGVDLALGRDGGDILVVGTPSGWFWLIPLDAHTTSVGMVVPGEVLRGRRGVELGAFFDSLIAASPIVSGRLARAR